MPGSYTTASAPTAALADTVTHTRTRKHKRALAHADQERTHISQDGTAGVGIIQAWGRHFSSCQQGHKDSCTVPLAAASICYTYGTLQ